MDDLSFTAKSMIEVSAFIERGNFHYKVNSIYMDSQNRPFFLGFAVTAPFNDADNTSPICEKQPLSHIFFFF